MVVKQSTVFIAGVGALGCEIAKDLALMGIGKLILCDMDTIETSNLSRQMLFYRGDEGRFKAEVAAERLKKMNPFLEVEVFTIPLQQIPMTKYMECDAVVAALDNVQARMDLNKFCLKLGIPLIEGGTVGFEGHVQVIIPESTRTKSGKAFPVGSKTSIMDRLVDEQLWILDESQFPEYFSAQSRIAELQEEIESLEKKYITPVRQQIREKIENHFDEYESKYMHHTPCYRCVVPVPPPLRNQVAACTLKGIPRTREHCAIKGEVHFIKKYDRKPDYNNPQDMQETLIYAQKELENLRQRVLDESIPPEMKNTITKESLQEIKQNILTTFGEDFALEDMENILGNKIPAIQSVSSIISSIQSQEILKILFLMNDHSIGNIMNPPYINYNGVFGLFEPVEISRLEDCVACGSKQGQENITVVVSSDATVLDLFKAVRDYFPTVNRKSFIITNPLTKQFVYNPLFEKGKTESKTLQEMELKNYSEVVFTAIGHKATLNSNPSMNAVKNENLQVKQYNVTIQMI
ncbi:MAG: ThiF family adenylyltransferase [Promethearchaeota archaeon]